MRPNGSNGMVFLLFVYVFSCFCRRLQVYGMDLGNLKYGFSECIDNKRTLYYYTDEESTCTQVEDQSTSIVYKPPVHGLRCDLSCERGYFLGANFSSETPISGCEKCEKGQYSLGGGKLYSKTTNAWSSSSSNKLPQEIYTDCMTRNLFTGAWQANCEPWKASEDGLYIHSGDNSDVANRFQAARLFSTLRISATFVRNGSLTYQYRVDAEAPYDGLVFEMDNQPIGNNKIESKTSDRRTGSGDWIEKTIQVSIGAHTFTWEYTKDFSGDKGEDKAFIKVIEFIGTSFSDIFCHSCGGEGGLTDMTGGIVCGFCEVNQYAAPKSKSQLDFECFDCPPDSFAPKGSIGIDSCVSQRPCTMEDVVFKYSTCVNNTRSVQYTWSEPSTCILEMDESIELPQDKDNIPCEKCARGFFLNNQTTECTTCPSGQIFSTSEMQCLSCPQGQIPARKMHFGSQVTQDGGGWTKWPSFFTNTEMEANEIGWKRTTEAIVFVSSSSSSFSSFSKSNDHRPTFHRRNGPKEFPLEFHVTFHTNGSFKLVYSLENLPTFERNGARAWLELEMDHLHVPLTNGAKNGTFTEVIPINLTSSAASTWTKKFCLVLRTTNLIAERMSQVKIKSFEFTGTSEGAAMECASCPPGFRVDLTSDRCQICPPGTFSDTKMGQCQQCPVNTYSMEGSSRCQTCGNNTFSNAGSRSCAVPALLSAVGAGLKVVYNLTQLQMLASIENPWKDQVNSVNSSTTKLFLPVTSVTPNETFRIDPAHSILFGIFQPVALPTKTMNDIQIHMVDTLKERPYVLGLTVLNPKDAGETFLQDTGRYGNVQCTIPAKLKTLNGGSHVEIEGLEEGQGVQVTYSNGSLCHNGQQEKTTIRFLCDSTAGTNTPPQVEDYLSAKCAVVLNWRTPFACPLCQKEYFTSVRSQCTKEGKQSIGYHTIRSCYGGHAPPPTQTAATCTEYVLDTKELYSVYAAISFIGFMVVGLMGAVFFFHRKYRSAYNEYMYLKGRMPANTTENVRGGGTETTFEFNNSPASIGSQMVDSPGGSSSTASTPSTLGHFVNDHIATPSSPSSLSSSLQEISIDKALKSV